MSDPTTTTAAATTTTASRPVPYQPLTDDQVELITKLAHNATAPLLGQEFYENLSIVEQADILAHGKHIYGMLMQHGEPDPAYRHNNHISKLLGDGWQYGDFFDTLNKFSPIIKEFSQLPEAKQQGFTMFTKLFTQFFMTAQSGKLIAPDEQVISMPVDSTQLEP